MHQRSAMQQFDRGAGGLGRGRMVLAAGRGHAVARAAAGPGRPWGIPRSASPRRAAAGIPAPRHALPPRARPARSGWRHPSAGSPFDSFRHELSICYLSHWSVNNILTPVNRQSRACRLHVPGIVSSIVGAGVAGLVAGLALAARGLEVTVLERGRGARRQDAADRDRRRADRQRPHRIHHALGVRRAVRQPPAGISPITSGCARWMFWRATPGTRSARLDLFADEERSVEAIGDFAGAAEAARYRAFCRDTRRIYDILEKPFFRAAQPSMGALGRRRRFSRADAAAADQAVLVDVVGALGNISTTRGCASCSAATPPIAAPRRSRRRPP